MFRIFILGAAVILSGCASFPAKGMTSRNLVDGLVQPDHQVVAQDEKSFSRASKMTQAGALVEATLYTPGYRKIKALAEARRTKETAEHITSKFKEIDNTTNPDRICFITYFEHASIDLAKPERWKLKVRLDDSEWLEMAPVDKNVVPDYVIRGASRYVGTDWTSTNMFCAAVPGWMKSNVIRLNVFPPVFVNPGEAMLEWQIN